MNESAKIRLGEIAHGRSGDKGDHANVAVIAYTPAGFAWLREHLTEGVVAGHLRRLGATRVERFEAANLLAVNFVLYNVLGGGASRSLRTDTQGKSLALALLEMEIDRPANLAEMLRPGRRAEETQMSDDLVKYQNRFPAAVITINRPDRRNALNRGVIAALQDAFLRARGDEAARVVILTGEGPAFCAGMDLAELEASLDVPPEETPVWDDALRLARLYDLIYTFPKPTIAAVNGSAVAGGAGLVSVCDLAVAAETAKFGYPEVRRGLVAAMVMPHLLRHVGERMARYLLLTGEAIDGEQAEECGLINESVPGHLLGDRVWQLVLYLAEGGPSALTQTKELLRQFSHQSVSVEEAAKGSAAPRLTAECKQGLKAFFAKERAPWSPKRDSGE